MSEVRKYLTRMNNCRKKIECPSCKSVMVLRDYRRHNCNPARGILDRRCVWCGLVDWKYGEMKNHVSHLHECMITFLRNNTVVTKPVTLSIFNNGIMDKLVAAISKHVIEDMRTQFSVMIKSVNDIRHINKDLLNRLQV